MLHLIERVRDAGKGFALMAHFSHPRELESKETQQAMRNLESAGATIRTQAPLIRGVNDSAETWNTMWRQTIRNGGVPYYMFVERDTGPADYFAVPLARGFDIFREAYKGVSGLGRTVRGPVMSTHPGKIQVSDVMELADSPNSTQKVFSLTMVQARNPDIVGKQFFAKYDPEAVWVDDLTPFDPAQPFPFTLPSENIMHEDWMPPFV